MKKGELMLVTKHEPYTLDLLNYEIAQSLSARVGKFAANRFTGKRVRGSSARLKGIKNREKRLRKLGMSVLLFAS